MNRRAAAGTAAAAVVAGAIALAVVLARDGGGGPSPGTATAPPAASVPAVTAPPGTAPVPVPADDLPGAPPPPWGDFAGAPPDLATPPGGSAAVAPLPAGDELTLRRADGSVLARASVDPSGGYTDARFYDREGRLTVVVDGLHPGVATGPAGGGGGARVRCGSASRKDAGYRWTAFPIRWHMSSRPLARGLSRAATLTAMRRARGTWNANRSHCRGIRDASSARFTYVARTPRVSGRDGVNLVEFGEVDGLGGLCAGTVACTITWLSGNRAVESDVRIDRDNPAGYSIRRRAGRFDVESVLVHESGHTLGFGHVGARDNVMFPTIARGSTAGRRLGRGDATANNAKY
ncbi:MAG: matrixin family metalloprotease [Thermoleophilia bacterium]